MMCASLSWMEPGARTSRNTFAIVAAIAAAALVIVAAWHFTAIALEDASHGRAPLERRAELAARASRLEPWSHTFRVRMLWLEGEDQLAKGDYNGAVETLTTAYRMDVGNTDLLAVFKRAQRVQALETVKKAHLQHGHEGPGGTLRPQDIER